MKPVTASAVLCIQLPAAAVLLAMWIASVWADVPATAFMREATAIAGINPLNGMATKLGAMVWSATIGIALFTATLCRRDSERRGLFLYFGALTAVLLFDDVFRFHDVWAPRLLPILPELTVYALYAGALLYGLIRYRRAIGAASGSLLCVAAVWFAVSLGCDMFLSAGSAWVYWLEDGAKLLGIVNWCACFSLLAASVLSRREYRDHRETDPWKA